MSRIKQKYGKWKSEMENELDDLVAKHFERLYNAKGSEYSKIWVEISRELYEKYDLMNLDKKDPEYELKCKKEHCIYINMRIYVEKEFPYELLEFSDDMINIPDLMDFLTDIRGDITLIGGGVDECLKEVIIALDALDKPYNVDHKWTY